MSIKFDDVLSDPSKFSSELFTAQAEPLNAAREAIKDACDQYNSDLTSRRAALEAQASDYASQLEHLSIQRNSLCAQITDLTSRGNIEAAADADAKLDAVEREISALERKQRLANSAELKGDATLFKTCKQAMTSLEEEHTAYRERMAAIKDAAAAEIKRLEAFISDLERALTSNHIHYESVAFTKVDRHFRELDRIEREWREKEAAERKAALEANKHKGVSYSFF